MKHKSSHPSQAEVGGSCPAFIADEMLGRLAKWMRLLGFDTLYAGDLPGVGALSDHQIAALARAQGRIVLTRDRELVRRKGMQCLWIESQILEAQLVEVVAALGYPEGDVRPGARCPRCNTALDEVPRHQARAHVPPYVWQTQRRFTHCRACDQYYWRGTHWQHFEATISRVLGRESGSE
jgi:uncharacterized protein with PIN domain